MIDQDQLDLGVQADRVPQHTEAHDDQTLSARVSLQLRDAVYRARREGETQSDAVRRLIQLGLDAERQAANAMTAGGTARRNDPDTAKKAAWEVAPRAGSQRATALKHISNAAARGLTADQVCALMPQHPVNGVARRVTDLLQGGLIEPALWIELSPGRPHVDAGVWRRRGIMPGEEPTLTVPPHVTRPTRHRSQATVYVITRAGLDTLTDLAVKAATK